MSAMVALPKGATVYVGGHKYKGEIPASVCPKKYLKDDKPSVSKAPKSDPSSGGTA